MHCVGRMTLSSLPAARDVSIDVGCFLPLFPLLSPPFTYCFSPAEPPNGPTKPLCLTVFSISFYPFHLCWSDPARPGVALALVLLLRLPARPLTAMYHPLGADGHLIEPTRIDHHSPPFPMVHSVFFFLCFALLCTIDQRDTRVITQTMCRVPNFAPAMAFAVTTTPNK